MKIKLFQLAKRPDPLALCICGAFRSRLEKANSLSEADIVLISDCDSIEEFQCRAASSDGSKFFAFGFVGTRFNEAKLLSNLPPNVTVFNVINAVTRYVADSEDVSFLAVINKYEVWHTSRGQSQSL